ncbi:MULTISPECIES: type III polyketide synthase [unclassified Kitasatospora]|uniref:type III polyketide synthase n=1 Tax=unclassified Kitasatospora TaxID=2633591 RepID=UPI00070AF7E0|nr:MULTISPECIES: type III polyketide synthase [unclassified Kitasatospora]KQV20027.1 polyketide synthase [Kitasatospora sp. Root107]KRB71241.1 polyketide synthase [Kitasatospora sp. Root187]
MATLCRPAVAVPEYVITLEETLELARSIHADHPQLLHALQLIENSRVRKRHLVQSAEEILERPGLEARTRRYEAEARRRVPPVVREALEHAHLTAKEIDLIVHVSCTGFMMPSLTAWLINSMGFRPETRRLPIAQLGCAADGAAINRAHDFCTAYPQANVLIVACEFCSLGDRPTDLETGTLLSDGLFGDAVAAAVVRGHGGTGVHLERNGSHLVPGTEDRRVPDSTALLAPVLAQLAGQHGWNASELDFYLVHAEGPRVLDELCAHLKVDPDRVRFSRATLAEYGNIGGAVVFDALARYFDEGTPTDRATGLIATFGPGITAEVTLGRWTVPVKPQPFAHTLIRSWN